MNDLDRFGVLLRHIATTDKIVFTWFYSFLAVAFTTGVYIVFYMFVSHFAGTHAIFLSLLGAAVVPYVIIYSLTWVVVAAGLAGLLLPEISGIDAVKKSADALHETARNIALPTVMVVATVNVVDFVFGFRAPIPLTLTFLGLLLGIAAWAKKFDIKDTLYKWYAGFIFFTMMPVLVAQYALSSEQKERFQEAISGSFDFLWSSWIAAIAALTVLWVLVGNPFTKKTG